jgi:DNA-binding protein HU-beta
MNKKQLIERMVDHTDSPKSEARKHLEAFTTTITEALKAGEEVQLPGFGKFYVREQKAREGKKPADRRDAADRGPEGSGFQGGQGLRGVRLVSAKAFRWHRPDLGVRVSGASNEGLFTRVRGR